MPDEVTGDPLRAKRWLLRHEGGNWGSDREGRWRSSLAVHVKCREPHPEI